MGTWPLWIAFNAGVALLLLLDLGLFHRRAHVISMREAAIESAGMDRAFARFWRVDFHFARPRARPGIFYRLRRRKIPQPGQRFRFPADLPVFSRRSPLPASPAVLGSAGRARPARRDDRRGRGADRAVRLDPLLFGAFLLYSGFKLFGADHAVHPEKNPVVRWAQKIPAHVTDTAIGAELIGAARAGDGCSRHFFSW